MNQDQTTRPSTFQRIIGQGFLFFKALHADPKTKPEAKLVTKYAEAHKKDRNLPAIPPQAECPRIAIWRGYVTLPGAEGGREVDIRAQANGREGQYIITVHAFPQDKAVTENWEMIGDGTAPLLGSNNYTDGSITVAGKVYKLRIMKTTEGYLRLRLPQVINTKQANEAAM